MYAMFSCLDLLTLDVSTTTWVSQQAGPGSQHHNYALQGINGKRNKHKDGAFVLGWTTGGGLPHSCVGSTHLHNELASWVRLNQNRNKGQVFLEFDEGQVCFRGSRRMGLTER